MNILCEILLIFKQKVNKDLFNEVLVLQVFITNGTFFRNGGGKVLQGRDLPFSSILQGSIK